MSWSRTQILIDHMPLVGLVLQLHGSVYLACARSGARHKSGRPADGSGAFGIFDILSRAEYSSCQDVSDCSNKLLRFS